MRPFYNWLPPTRGAGGYVEAGVVAGRLPGEDLPVPVVHVHYVCAVVGSNETKFLYRVKKGLRVMTVSLRQGISASGGATSTWSIGDAANNAGYMVATTTVNAAGTTIDGKGTYCTSTGKLYNAIDSVNLYYTASATPGTVPPTCEVRLTIQQEWPEV